MFHHACGGVHGSYAFSRVLLREVPSQPPAGTSGTQTRSICVRRANVPASEGQIAARASRRGRSTPQPAADATPSLDVAPSDPAAAPRSAHKACGDAAVEVCGDGAAARPRERLRRGRLQLLRESPAAAVTSQAPAAALTVPSAASAPASPARSPQTPALAPQPPVPRAPLERVPAPAPAPPPAGPHLSARLVMLAAENAACLSSQQVRQLVAAIRRAAEDPQRRPLQLPPAAVDRLVAELRRRRQLAELHDLTEAVLGGGGGGGGGQSSGGAGGGGSAAEVAALGMQQPGFLDPVLVSLSAATEAAAVAAAAGPVQGGAAAGAPEEGLPAAVGGLTGAGAEARAGGRVLSGRARRGSARQQAVLLEPQPQPKDAAGGPAVALMQARAGHREAPAPVAAGRVSERLHRGASAVGGGDLAQGSWSGSGSSGEELRRFFDELAAAGGRLLPGEALAALEACVVVRALPRRDTFEVLLRTIRRAAATSAAVGAAGAWGPLGAPVEAPVAAAPQQPGFGASAAHAAAPAGTAAETAAGPAERSTGALLTRPRPVTTPPGPPLSASLHSWPLGEVGPPAAAVFNAPPAMSHGRFTAPAASPPLGLPGSLFGDMRGSGAADSTSSSSSSRSSVTAINSISSGGGAGVPLAPARLVAVLHGLTRLGQRLSQPAWRELLSFLQPHLSFSPAPHASTAAATSSSPHTHHHHHHHAARATPHSQHAPPPPLPAPPPPPPPPPPQPLSHYDLVDLAEAMAAAGCNPSTAFLAAHAAAVAGWARQLTGRQAARLLWAYAALDYSPPPAVLGMLAATVQAQVHGVSEPLEVARAAAALVLLAEAAADSAAAAAAAAGAASVPVNGGVSGTGSETDDNVATTAGDPGQQQQPQGTSGGSSTTTSSSSRLGSGSGNGLLQHLFEAAAACVRHHRRLCRAQRTALKAQRRLLWAQQQQQQQQRQSRERLQVQTEGHLQNSDAPGAGASAQAAPSELLPMDDLWSWVPNPNLLLGKPSPPPSRSPPPTATTTAEATAAADAEIATANAAAGADAVAADAASLAGHAAAPPVPSPAERRKRQAAVEQVRALRQQEALLDWLAAAAGLPLGSSGCVTGSSGIGGGEEAEAGTAAGASGAAAASAADTPMLSPSRPHLTLSQGGAGVVLRLDWSSAGPAGPAAPAAAAALTAHGKAVAESHRPGGSSTGSCSGTGWPPLLPEPLTPDGLVVVSRLLCLRGLGGTGSSTGSLRPAGASATMAAAGGGALSHGWAAHCWRLLAALPPDQLRPADLAPAAQLHCRLYAAHPRLLHADATPSAPVGPASDVAAAPAPLRCLVAAAVAGMDRLSYGQLVGLQAAVAAAAAEPGVRAWLQRQQEDWQQQQQQQQQGGGGGGGGWLHGDAALLAAALESAGVGEDSAAKADPGAWLAALLSPPRRHLQPAAAAPTESARAGGRRAARSQPQENEPEPELHSSTPAPAPAAASTAHAIQTPQSPQHPSAGAPAAAAAAAAAPAMSPAASAAALTCAPAAAPTSAPAAAGTLRILVHLLRSCADARVSLPPQQLAAMRATWRQQLQLQPQPQAQAAALQPAVQAQRLQRAPAAEVPAAVAAAVDAQEVAELLLAVAAAAPNAGQERDEAVLELAVVLGDAGGGAAAAAGLRRLPAQQLAEVLHTVTVALGAGVAAWSLATSATAHAGMGTAAEHRSGHVGPALPLMLQHQHRSPRHRAAAVVRLVDPLLAEIQRRLQGSAAAVGSAPVAGCGSAAAARRAVAEGAAVAAAWPPQAWQLLVRSLARLAYSGPAWPQRLRQRETAIAAAARNVGLSAAAPTAAVALGAVAPAAAANGVALGALAAQVNSLLLPESRGPPNAAVARYCLWAIRHLLAPPPPSAGSAAAATAYAGPAPPPPPPQLAAWMRCLAGPEAARHLRAMHPRAAADWLALCAAAGVAPPPPAMRHAWAQLRRAAAAQLLSTSQLCGVVWCAVRLGIRVPRDVLAAACEAAAAAHTPGESGTAAGASLAVPAAQQRYQHQHQHQQQVDRQRRALASDAVRLLWAVQYDDRYTPPLPVATALCGLLAGAWHRRPNSGPGAGAGAGAGVGAGGVDTVSGGGGGGLLPSERSAALWALARLPRPGAERAVAESGLGRAVVAQLMQSAGLHGGRSGGRSRSGSPGRGRSRVAAASMSSSGGSGAAAAPTREARCLWRRALAVPAAVELTAAGELEQHRQEQQRQEQQLSRGDLVRQCWALAKLRQPLPLPLLKYLLGRLAAAAAAPQPLDPDDCASAVAQPVSQPGAQPTGSSGQAHLLTPKEAVQALFAAANLRDDNSSSSSSNSRGSNSRGSKGSSIAGGNKAGAGPSAAHVGAMVALLRPVLLAAPPAALDARCLADGLGVLSRHRHLLQPARAALRREQQPLAQQAHAHAHAQWERERQPDEGDSQGEGQQQAHPRTPPAAAAAAAAAPGGGGWRSDPWVVAALERAAELFVASVARGLGDRPVPAGCVLEVLCAAGYLRAPVSARLAAAAAALLQLHMPEMAPAELAEVVVLCAAGASAGAGAGAAARVAGASDGSSVALPTELSWEALRRLVVVEAEARLRGGSSAAAAAEAAAAGPEQDTAEAVATSAGGSSSSGLLEPDELARVVMAATQAVAADLLPESGEPAVTATAAAATTAAATVAVAAAAAPSSLTQQVALLQRRRLLSGYVMALACRPDEPRMAAMSADQLSMLVEGVVAAGAAPGAAWLRRATELMAAPPRLAAASGLGLARMAAALLRAEHWPGEGWVEACRRQADALRLAGRLPKAAAAQLQRALTGLRTLDAATVATLPTLTASSGTTAAFTSSSSSAALDAVHQHTASRPPRSQLQPQQQPQPPQHVQPEQLQPELQPLLSELLESEVHRIMGLARGVHTAFTAAAAAVLRAPPAHAYLSGPAPDPTRGAAAASAASAQQPGAAGLDAAGAAAAGADSGAALALRPSAAFSKLLLLYRLAEARVEQVVALTLRVALLQSAYTMHMLQQQHRAALAAQHARMLPAPSSPGRNGQRQEGLRAREAQLATSATGAAAAGAAAALYGGGGSGDGAAAWHGGDGPCPLVAAWPRASASDARRGTSGRPLPPPPSGSSLRVAPASLEPLAAMLGLPPPGTALGRADATGAAGAAGGGGGEGGGSGDGSSGGSSGGRVRLHRQRRPHGPEASAASEPSLVPPTAADGQQTTGSSRYPGGCALPPFAFGASMVGGNSSGSSGSGSGSGTGWNVAADASRLGGALSGAGPGGALQSAPDEQLLVSLLHLRSLGMVHRRLYD